MQLSFKNYIDLSESKRDLVSAIGYEKATKLLNTPKIAKIQKLHDKVFGLNGKRQRNKNIEIPLSNDLPSDVKDHIESNGDTVHENQTHVILKSGRHVPIQKYLPKAKTPKSVVTSYENHLRNPQSDTKLVVTDDSTACSTGTNWDSCANAKKMKDDPDLAAAKLPKDVKHGTLMAMEVHKDAKPNEDGEYDGKDIRGRVLLKRHDDIDGNHTIFKPEKVAYGDFSDVAKRATSKFADKNYPKKPDTTYRKHPDLYDDDRQTFDISDNKLDDMTTHHNRDVRLAVAKHKNTSSESIGKLINDPDEEVRDHALQHKNVSKEQLHAVISDDKKSYRDKITALAHGNIDETHIHTALDDPNYAVRKDAAAHYGATDENLNKALHDKEDVVKRMALNNQNIKKSHIDAVLNDDTQSNYVKRVAIQSKHADMHHVEKYVNSEDETDRLYAARNPNLTHKHIEKLMADENPTTRSVLLKHKNITKEQVTRLADNDKDNHVRNEAERRLMSMASAEKVRSKIAAIKAEREAGN